MSLFSIQIRVLFPILRVALTALLLVVLLAGCTMFNKPQAAHFKWSGRIVVFPVSVGVHEAAKGVVEPIIYDILSENEQWLIKADDAKGLLEASAKNKEIYENYFSFLSVLHFSDVKLSKQLADILGGDYFLFTFVEGWGYHKEGKQEYAYVLLKLVVVEAATGKIIWRESRSEREKVLWSRPPLERIAQKLLESAFLTGQQKR